MSKDQPISIIVPTLNEAENIPKLMARIDRTMKSAGITYETIIVDDHSKDSTLTIADRLEHLYPMRTVLKRGKRGKAYSLLQGFQEARYPLIAMIDADLQYPPEEIARMYDLMQDSQADLIVSRRIQHNISKVRKLSTKVFNLVFARALFGINFDTQSGLKLFRKHMLTRFGMAPSPWSFDLEFIVRAIEHKFKIASHDIPFEERVHGETKVRLLSTTFELAKASLSLWTRTSSGRIREGLRANNHFLSKAFPAALLTMLTAGAFIASPVDVSALSPVKFDRQNISPARLEFMDDLKKIIVPADTRRSESTAANEQPVMTTAVATTAQQPTTNGDAPAPTATAKPAAVTTSQQSTPASDAPTTPQPAATDRSTLAPATAETKKTDVYDKDYPNYTLDDKKTELLNDGAKYAVAAAVGCLTIATLIIGARATKNLGTKLVTGS